MDCKLDWLSFTWKSGVEFNDNEFYDFLKVFPEIAEIMPEHNIIKDKKGGYGNFYDTVLNFQDKFALSFSRERLGGDQKDINLGVNISVPAHGLEYFYSLFNFDTDQSIDVLRFLSEERGCQFSRLDFAFDDYSKRFHPVHYNSWFTNIGLDKLEGCGGRMMTTKCRCSKLIGREQVSGQTFYLGSRDNGRLLRIYDKAYESEGRIDAIRYEFEFHTKYTPDLINYILNNGYYPTFEEFIHIFIIDIVDVAPGKRKDQGVSYQEWNDFVSASNPPLTHRLTLKATRPEECSSKMQKKWKYYCRSALTDLCAYRYLFGSESFNYLMDEFENSDAYFDKVHKRLDELKRDYRNNEKVIDGIFFTSEGKVNPHWVDNVKSV